MSSLVWFARTFPAQTLGVIFENCLRLCVRDVFRKNGCLYSMWSSSQSIEHVLVCVCVCLFVLIWVLRPTPCDQLDDSSVWPSRKWHQAVLVGIFGRDHPEIKFVYDDYLHDNFLFLSTLESHSFEELLSSHFVVARREKNSCRTIYRNFSHFFR